jgi:hypothetical protein
MNILKKNTPDINSYNKKSHRYKITRGGKAVYYSFKNEDSKEEVYMQFKEAWAQGIIDKGVPKSVKRRQWQIMNKFINHMYKCLLNEDIQVTMVINPDDKRELTMSKFADGNQFFNYQVIQFNEWGYGWASADGGEQQNVPHFKIDPSLLYYKRAAGKTRKVMGMYRKDQFKDQFDKTDGFINLMNRKKAFLKECLESPDEVESRIIKDTSNEDLHRTIIEGVLDVYLSDGAYETYSAKDNGEWAQQLDPLHSYFYSNIG